MGEDNNTSFELYDHNGTVIGKINGTIKDLDIEMSDEEREKYKWMMMDDPITLSLTMTKWQAFKFRWHMAKQFLFHK